MKVEAIPNKGPASMGPEIEHSLNWAEEVDIASAFVTPAALKRLESALNRAKKEKRSLKIRLIFGLYQRFTPPQALDKMHDLQKAHPGKLFVRVARNNRFHWKLYTFRKGNSRRLYVGSANFTEDGLGASGELSVKLTTKASDSIARSLETEFDALWQKGAFLLNQGVLDKYWKVKRPPQIVTAPKKDDAISALLEKAERLPAPPPSTIPKPRVAFIDDDLADETIAIIDTETDWHKKGWYYICYWYKHWHDPVRNAKVILYITWIDDPKEYVLEFRRIEESVEIQTPDGKYFVAHSRVPHGWRRKYDDVKEELKEAGLTWKKLKSDCQLTSQQLEVLCRLLHVTPEKLLQQ